MRNAMPIITVAAMGVLGAGAVGWGGVKEPSLNISKNLLKSWGEKLDN
jgi:hypothetical protein